MIDLAMTQQTDGTYDLEIENGDFKAVAGFDTAILLSLLTDQRAEPEQVVVPENRRGWLGDLNSPVDGRKIGSLLWTLEQRRLTQENVNAAVDFARKAEDWFVEDSLLQSVVVSGEIIAGSGIRLNIVATSEIGITSNHYVNLWEVTGAN